MNIHKNAPWSPHGRADAVQRILEQRQPTTQVAAAFGVSERTMHKWLARFRAEGPPGLQDRSSRPHQVPGATPAVVVAQIERLRESYSAATSARRRPCTSASTEGAGISSGSVTDSLRSCCNSCARCAPTPSSSLAGEDPATALP
jgi:transposase-like protein